MTETKRQKDGRTRRAILDHLKVVGPSEAAAVAHALSLTAMAVRQHLYQLADEQMVVSEAVPRPIGRPAKRWRLTEEARQYFPDAHADLTTGLLAALRETFGEEGLERLIKQRTKDQVAAYRRALPGKDASLKERLEVLASLRSAEGYMAAVEQTGEGEFLFLEHHCPICAAAESCSGLCASELEVFGKILGKTVKVSREDHILAGANRCAYRVTAR